MQSEKKKYLNHYLLQEARINRLYEMIRINPSRKAEYEAKILNSKKLREDIEEKISQVDDQLLCELLYQKYILGKTLEDIAIILNYSKRHIERLHIKALEKFKM